jgi:hydrogenase maturation protein HypF
MGPMADRAQIIVRGIVQGVGFRPFVYNLAESLNLKGYVTNTSEGVFIDLEGTRVSEFVLRLKKEAPPLSQITDVSVTSLPVHGYSDFTIHRSVDQSDHLPFTLISPDVSVCDDCLREMLDTTDRRYLYPFINCTNCGPRYSITKSVPYDRPNTTMSDFTMCPDCLKEYHDPRDRRFHAQPNACAACGPQVEFWLRSAECGVKGNEAIKETITLLQKGGIVAVKGIGGFHIACDATNDDAVKRLRERKRKSNKPFAVMSPTVESAEQFSVISDAEKEHLRSIRRPIVLLQKRNDRLLSDAVSPKNQFIGIMLPYTPVHYLLFHHPLGRSRSVDIPHFHALVMTSGNLSEEPIVSDNEEAVNKLSKIVDGFLLHDRDIFMRVDDSVVRVQSAEFKVHGIRQDVANNSELRTANSELTFIRRSRGYAPDSIALHDDGLEVLGCGADLKTTFTLTKGKFAIPSQHIGDMENYETLKFYEESLANLKAVYRADPAVFVHDLHPGYGTTRWAIEKGSGDRGQGSGKPETRNSKPEIRLFAIQHHYAHIGSVMAEYGLKNRVIGVALDGTGYGTDGHLWGGEFLIAGIDGFERVGQFQYVPLPGGESAIREPWRTAVSYVLQADPEGALDHLQKIGFVQKYGQDTIKNLLIVIRSQELSPLASGAGRLFDAVSALLGICDTNTFEGEAAISLESFTQPGIYEEYEVAIKEKNSYSVIDFSPVLLAIIDDRSRGVDREIIATKFHNTVASAVQAMVGRLRRGYGLSDVVLSGGTFQNLYLLNRLMPALSAAGLNVFTNHQVPCNDACVSLGQAYLIRERLKK